LFDSITPQTPFLSKANITQPILFSSPPKILNFATLLSDKSAQTGPHEVDTEQKLKKKLKIESIPRLENTSPVTEEHPLQKIVGGYIDQNDVNIAENTVLGHIVVYTDAIMADQHNNTDKPLYVLIMPPKNNGNAVYEGWNCCKIVQPFCNQLLTTFNLPKWPTWDLTFHGWQNDELLTGRLLPVYRYRMLSVSIATLLNKKTLQRTNSATNLDNLRNRTGNFSQTVSVIGGAKKKKRGG
jgi:hypothetical protein